jgi:hypothetical protein
LGVTPLALLLDLARLEGGRRQLDCRTTELVGLARSVVEHAQAQTSRYALPLEPPTQAMVNADPVANGTGAGATWWIERV